MIENRNDRMDYFKGLLMLGVIWGHTITALKSGTDLNVYVHVFVRTYDMPFFMLISGLFLAKSVDKYVPWKNILNKISSIMIPLVVWNGIFYILQCVIFLFMGKGLFSFKGLLVSFTGSWFLWSALACSCLMIAICGMFKKTQTRAIISFLISLSLLFVPKDMWHLAFMFPFFAVGFFAQKLISMVEAKTIARLKVFADLAFVVLLCFWDTKYNVWNAGSYLLGGEITTTAFAVVYRFLIGLTGCIAMTAIFDMLMKSENHFMKIINREIVSVGKNTMMIYLFQGFIIEWLLANCVSLFVRMCNFNPFTFNANFLGYIIAPVTGFVCMIIFNRIIIAMRQIPYVGKYVFGFKAIDAKKK